MISAKKAAALKPVLDSFVESRPWFDRVQADPIEFPHRYSDPRDIEVVALLSASLAYGRADLFKPKIASILDGLGSSPARAMAALDVKGAKALLEGFVYRFNLPADLGVLLLGIGATLNQYGSLEAAFLRGRTASWQATLAEFTRGIRKRAPEAKIVKALGPTRGLHHLLPSAEAGAAKRLNLYLRWLVRKDEIDLGVWKQISPGELMIPLDTHVMRISRWLGFTERNTIGWKTAEEITASLRLLDGADPIRYDFALCHYGMSGACPVVPIVENCRECELRPWCSGRR